MKFLSERKKIIKDLRKIIHKKEYNIKLKNEEIKELPKDKIKYKIKKQDIEKMEYFCKHFLKLKQEHQKEVLKQEKNNIKIYEIKNETKKFIGSTSTTLHYFIKFNLFLFLDEQKSVFNIFTDNKNELVNIECRVLEIINNEKGTRDFINKRKEYYNNSNENGFDIRIIDKYMSIYKSLSCKEDIKGRKRIFIYTAQFKKSNKNMNFLFYTHRKITNDEKVIEKLKNEKLLNIKEIKLKLLEKTTVHNELELLILKDNFILKITPNINNLNLEELKNIKFPLNIDLIKNLKIKIQLRLNLLRFKKRLKNKFGSKLKGKKFIYLFKNKINGNSLIKMEEIEPIEIVSKFYENSLKNHESKMGKDLILYGNQDFQFKILRVLKKEDDINYVLKRFKMKYNPTGYDVNLRQIYAISKNKN